MNIYQAKPEEIQDVLTFYYSLIDALDGMKFAPACKKIFILLLEKYRMPLRMAGSITVWETAESQLPWC